jgi:hypothetical protein
MARGSIWPQARSDPFDLEAAMDLKFLDLARFRPAPVVAPVVASVVTPPLFDGLPQVRAYWEALRKTGGLPQRAALDPRGLSGVLDRVFIAERIGRGVVQVRIAGSGLADFAGLDLRGLPLCCLFAPEARPLIGEAVEEVCQTPSVVELDLASDRGDGKVVARLLLLPLADEQDRTLLLGALSFAKGRAGRCKFRVMRRQVERVFPAVVPSETRPPAPVFGHLRLVHCRPDQGQANGNGRQVALPPVLKPLGP